MNCENFILSCYQVNALHATAGRGLLALATKSLGHEGAGGAKWQAGMDKEKGKEGRLGFEAEKENVLQSPLSLLLQGLQGKQPFRRWTGIFFSHLLTLHDSSVTYILQTNKIDGSHSCTSTWPRLTHFANATSSSTSPYWFQWSIMPEGLKAGVRSLPRQGGTPSGETTNLSGDLRGYRTLPSSDSKLDLCLGNPCQN